MRIDNLRQLIGTLTFIQLRELSCEYIRFRGYGDPVITDGWRDGGSDLRVHQIGAPSPRRIAIQTSVQEKNWKTKLKEDARKALGDLGCVVFLYVTNRRLADAEYQPVADELLQQDGISCSKADGDNLAQYVLNDNKVDWLLDLMGIQIEGRNLSRSIRQEVTDAFILFSDEAEEYRRTFMELAIMVVANHDNNGSREQILVAAQQVLGFEEDVFTGQLSGRFDSLLSRSVIIKIEDGTFALSKEEANRISQAYRIRDSQWITLLDAIQAILRMHCPSAVSNDSITSSSLEIATRLGQVLRAYRDYQVKILENRVTDEDLRKRCIREASSIEAMLTSAGIPQGDIAVCQAELSRLQETNPVVALLEAGETFRRLVAGNKQNLLNALGQTAGVVVVLDTSVLIPLLCGELNGEIKDPTVAGAMHLLDDAIRNACPVYVPSVYIEEAAAHLIMAGRYEPVVLSVERSEVRRSENAFVAYFAMSDIPTKGFREFLKDFGFRGERIDFYRHIDTISDTIIGLLRRYGLKWQDIQQRTLDRDAIKDADIELGSIYHQLGEDRPDILYKHDSYVLASMKIRANLESKAQLFVTWDRCMQLACKGIHELCLGLDPMNAAELFELAVDMGNHAPAIELIMQLGDKEVSLASMVWDVIVGVEEDDLSDARLLVRARAFRDDFVARQQSDAVRTRQIVDAWRQWKAAAGEQNG